MFDENRSNKHGSNSLLNTINKVATTFVKAIYKECEEIREIFKMDEAIMFLKDSKKQYPQLTKFVLSVKPNPESKGTTDKFIITQVLLDDWDKPVTFSDNTCLSQIISSGSIDNAMIAFLDGSETKIYTRNQNGVIS